MVKCRMHVELAKTVINKICRTIISPSNTFAFTKHMQSFVFIRHMVNKRYNNYILAYLNISYVDAQ